MTRSPRRLGAAVRDAPLAPRAAREMLAERARPQDEPSLSARKREVLGLVARGMPNKLIARELDIREKTVKAHLTSVFSQLGVTDRTQAALWAQHHIASDWIAISRQDAPRSDSQNPLVPS